MAEDDRDGYEEWRKNPDLAEIFLDFDEVFRPFFEGVELAKLGDSYAAEMRFREAVRKHEYPNAYFNLAQSLYFQANDFYNKAIELVDDHFEEMAKEYGGRLPKEYFTEEVPENLEYLHLKGKAWFHQFVFDKSYMVYSTIIRGDSEDVEGWRGIMRCLLMAGLYRKAETARRVAEGLVAGSEPTEEGIDVSKMMVKFALIGLPSPQELIPMQPFNLM